MSVAASAYAASAIEDTAEGGTQRPLSVVAHLDWLIARIDEVIAAQVDVILHAPDFQALEARWRALAALLQATAGASDVVVRLLDVDWRTLARDMERASDFDRSTLFRLVHDEEFGMPGGQPFGLLVGDYEVSHATDRARGDQVEVLRRLSSVAAAAFCPLVLGAAPDCFGVERHGDLAGLADLGMTSGTLDRQRWDRLRENEDTRFIGVVAPRVLLRARHRMGNRRRADGFVYGETAGGPLWGSGAFAFAVVVVNAFRQSGWFAEIRGAWQDAPGGGVVDVLRPHDFGTDCHGHSALAPLEVRLTSSQEQQMAEAGIIPLASVHLFPAPVFNTNPSLHKPAAYHDPAAQQNARLAAMLQYVLCASRFAHYLRVIMRDEVGTIASEAMLERKLNDWLAQYCLGNDDAELELRARYPLRSAGVSVRPVPGRPGTYTCMIHLQPHFQLDHLATSFQLVAEAVETTRKAG